MEWFSQLEGLLFSLTYWIVMISIVLAGVWGLFTEEGKQFRQAKKNREPINKNEYKSKLRKTAMILAGVVAPIFIILGLIAHLI